jgi:hypothetical protein
MSGALQLSDGPDSLSAGPFPVRLGTTLGIGQNEPVTVPLDTVLPDGPWTARLTLASGTVQHTITATLTFPQAAGASSPVALDTSLFTATQIGVYAAGALLVAGVLCAFWVARRRRVRVRVRGRGYHG